MKEENYRRAKENSVNKNAQKYRPYRKDVDYKTLNKGFISIALVAVVAAGALGYGLNNNTNPKLSDRAEIQNLIYNYQNNLMSSSSNDTQKCFAFEFSQRLDNVSYNPRNLADDIIKESEKSAYNVRSLLLASYKVVNKGYLDQIDIAFRIINENPETLPFDFLKVNSFEEYVKALGYDDINDYYKHEEAKITKLSVIEKIAEEGVIR